MMITREVESEESNPSEEEKIIYFSGNRYWTCHFISSFFLKRNIYSIIISLWYPWENDVIRESLSRIRYNVRYGQENYDDFCPDQMIKIRRHFFFQNRNDHPVSTASERRSTTLSIELINDRRDISVAGYNAANEVTQRRKEKDVQSHELRNTKLDYSSEICYNMSTGTF